MGDRATGPTVTDLPGAVLFCYAPPALPFRFPLLAFGAMPDAQAQTNTVSLAPAKPTAAADNAKVSGKTTCGEITDADLAGITGTFSVPGSRTSLKSGDFDGMSAATTLEYVQQHQPALRRF